MGRWTYTPGAHQPQEGPVREPFGHNHPAGKWVRCEGCESATFKYPGEAHICSGCSLPGKQSPHPCG